MSYRKYWDKPYTITKIYEQHNMPNGPIHVKDSGLFKIAESLLFYGHPNSVIRGGDAIPTTSIIELLQNPKTLDYIKKNELRYAVATYGISSELITVLNDLGFVVDLKEKISDDYVCLCAVRSIYTLPVDTLILEEYENGIGTISMDIAIESDETNMGWRISDALYS